MRMKTVRAPLVLALGLVAGCYTTRNHGSGECRDYQPVCLSGYVQCAADEKGCTVCTCTHQPTAAPPGYPPPPH
jgi:hypothetical protein